MANQIDRFLQVKGQSSCCRVPCPTQEDSKQQMFQSTATHDSFKPPNSDKVLPFCSSETTICQWRKFDILRMPGSEMQVSSLTIPYHWSCVSCTYRMKSGNCLNIPHFLTSMILRQYNILGSIPRPWMSEAHQRSTNPQARSPLARWPLKPWSFGCIQKFHQFAQ